MKRKEIITPILAVVLLVILVVLFIPNKSMSRYYYNLKDIYEITDAEEWDIQTFETAFKKAVEAEGIKVSNCFISGWIPYEMDFHVLTENNDYILFNIDVSKTQYLSPDKVPIYYVSGTSLYLDTSKIE